MDRACKTQRDEDDECLLKDIVKCRGDEEIDREVEEPVGERDACGARFKGPAFGR